MDKVSQYYPLIRELVERLPSGQEFSVKEKTDYSIKFSNSYCSIDLGFDRYYPGVQIRLIDEMDKKNYYLWEIYEYKESPKVDCSFSENDDETQINLKHNLGFIRLFLEKELMGDFRDLKENLPKM